MLIEELYNWPKPEIDSFVLQQGFCEHVRNLPLRVSPHWLSLPAGPPWSFRAEQHATAWCMLFIACSKTSRRAWHGSIDSGKLEECCIGWCSETCRIERTCGCRTTFPRNTAKLLKAILIVSLAFPICAPRVFHAQERTGWILKESPKFTMVQQVNWARKRCQPLQNQNRGRRGRELRDGSCTSLGRGWHTQKGRKVIVKFFSLRAYSPIDEDDFNGTASNGKY